ncbi:MAG: VWA domain-containing protein [Bacteroidota bacterium]
MEAHSFSDHVVAFGRVLRRLGFAIGPAQMMVALEAVAHVGVSEKEDVKNALHACLVSRHEERELFDLAFKLFWKAPTKFPKVMQWLLQQTQIPVNASAGGYHRIQEALREHQKPKPKKRSEQTSATEIELEQIVTYSQTEILRQKDFAAFTNADIATAKQYVARFKWPIPPYASRRLLPASRGIKLDFRATVRDSSRHAGELLRLAHLAKKKKPRPVVLICDISGSMERYAQMLLHFMHLLTADKRSVESFVFGTRITRITHHLKHQDVDAALAAVSKEVLDWAGGTKIGDAIKTFNFTWLRRVMKSNSVVLIISDGWDRGDTTVLSSEMQRLRRSCHQLIWLNPLMGYSNYEPLTQGMQAALPYVDHLLPVHNLVSLEQLTKVLAQIR